MLASYQDRTFSDILIEEGIVTASRLSQILAERESATEPLGDLLMRLGLLTEKSRARCLGKQEGVPFVDLSEREIDPAVSRLVAHGVAVRLGVIPIDRTDFSVTMAMANPLDIVALDELQVHLKLEIDPVVAAPEDIKEAIFRAFGSYDDLGELVGEAIREVDPDEIRVANEMDASDAEISINQLKLESEGSKIVRLVNAVLTRAIAVRTSDIHIEPERGRVRVRYRVDGILQEAMTMPKDLQQPFVSRLKIIAGMDIAERRAPQDGRLTLLTPQGEYDFRLSTYPSLHGENVVIRILDRKAARISLDKLGFQPDILTSLQNLIRRPHGMFLVCGPTGSGKTTTLYAALNALNSVERNIMTIEDPVEYQVPGIIQGNVNAKAGVTFATGLRTLVRQDPDVILVGEIRDPETARTAVEAALTGHLVLSTIHANDSAGAVTRLLDMGIEPFLVASALVGTLAQRLLRVLCPRCAAPYSPDAALLDGLGVADSGLEFRRGAGCESCSRTGYKGRTGIYEMMEVGESVQRLILAHASTQEIKAAALDGKRTLREDALLRLRQGVTTPEEVARVTVG